MAAPQDKKHVRHYARIILKRGRISIVFFVVVVVTALIYDFKRNVERVPVYQASAVILIEETARPISPIPDPYRYGPSFIETQLELLRTSTVIAAKVLEKLGRPSDYQSALKFQRMINARTTKGNLITVSVTAPEPQQAIDLTNTLAETFVEEDKLRRYGASREAIHLLAQQADAMRKELNETESKFQKFKEENDFVAFDVANESAAKLRELIHRMIQEQTRSVEMRARMEAAPSPDATAEGQMASSDSQSDRVQQLATEKATVEQQLKEYTARYKAKHPKVVALQTRISELNAQIRKAGEMAVSGIKSGYEESQLQLEKLAKAVADEKRNTLDMSKKIIEYEALKKDVESVKELYNLVLTRIRQADLTTEVQGNTMSIVSRAQSAMELLPDKKRTILVALAIGLIMGIGLPLFFEYLDDTVKDPDDLEQRVGLALIGTVNAFPEADGRGKRSIVIEEDPNSPVAEAYRAIRTNIVFAAAQGKLKTMLVTSVGPGEGKTTTALNVAVSMAKSGTRVLLVDSDMRRPRIHKALDMDTAPGLSNFLVGETDLDGVVRPSKIEGLDVVTCGPIPPNPAELLSSEKMKEFVNVVRDKYDRVLFDSPPALAVTDAAVLGAILDGTFLVVHAGRAKYEMAIECKERLQSSGSHIVGGVLNNVTARLARYHYSYYYRYGYYKQS